MNVDGPTEPMRCYAKMPEIAAQSDELNASTLERRINEVVARWSNRNDRSWNASCCTPRDARHLRAMSDDDADSGAKRALFDVVSKIDDCASTARDDRADDERRTQAPLPNSCLSGMSTLEGELRNGIGCPDALVATSVTVDSVTWTRSPLA